jgi:hypothetical protein
MPANQLTTHWQECPAIERKFGVPLLRGWSANRKLSGFHGGISSLKSASTRKPIASDLPKDESREARLPGH